MLLGELSALGAALSWALNGVLLRPVTRRAPALRITALQYLVVALLFLAFGVATGRLDAIAQLSSAQLVGLVVVALLGLVVGDTSYVRGLSLLGLARTVTLSTAGYVLIAFMLAVVVLEEPVTSKQLLGTVVVLAGVWLVAGASGGSPAQAIDSDRRPAVGALTRDATREGLAFTGLAALCWGVNTVILKLILVGTDVLTANIVRIPTAAIVLNVASLYYHGFDARAYDRRTASVIGLAGLLGLGLGSLMFLFALQEAGAARTVVLSSTSPLFAAVMAVTFLRERVTLRLAAGTAISVAGVWLVV